MESERGGGAEKKKKKKKKKKSAVVKITIMTLSIGTDKPLQTM